MLRKFARPCPIAVMAMYSLMGQYTLEMARRDYENYKSRERFLDNPPDLSVLEFKNVERPAEPDISATICLLFEKPAVGLQKIQRVSREYLAKIDRFAARHAHFHIPRMGRR